MSNLVFNTQLPYLLRINDEDSFFPIHNVYCIGRNYREHILEMGHSPEKEVPFFFQKNAENLNQSGFFNYPKIPALNDPLSSIHHEVELMVALKDGGHFLSKKEAQKTIFGFAIALDLTKRNLQAQLKKKGHPWEMAKAFPFSAPCNALTKISQTGMLVEGEISLKVNNHLRQQGNLKDMIWNIPEIISTLSYHVPLSAGDVILTGTPKGTGPILPGDELYGEIEGLPPLCVKVL